MIWSRYGGRVGPPGELETVLIPGNWRFDGSRRVIIFCHGAGGDGLTPVNTLLTGQYPLLRALGERYAMVCHDLGGGATWGNLTAQARIASVWAWAKASLGCKQDKCLLAATSMGNLAALNFAASNRSEVAAVAGFIPAVDTQALRAVGYGAAIEAAWGIGAGAPLPVDANPALRAAELAGLPWAAWHSTADTVATPQPITTLVGAMGAPAQSTVVSTTLGHSEAAVALVPPVDVLAFLEAHG